MRLVKDNDVLNTNDINIISAFKEAGYVEEAEAEEVTEAKPVRKTKK